MIYFAYGSNLCYPRFVSRVQSAQFIAVSKLDGYRIVFHKKSKDKSGKATLLRAENEVTYGALYTFINDDFIKLRNAEGWPKDYEERNVPAITLDGTIAAVTYIATAPHYDDKQVPYDWYVDLVRFGARRLGLPAEYIAKLDDVVCKNDPDKERARRERAFLR